MEFFRIIDIKSTENQLQQLLSFKNINDIIESLFVIDFEKDTANITGIWEEFTLKRDEIKGGVRFALVECPNALAWTITTGFPPVREHIVIHLTINRTEKEQHFIDELTAFLDDWESGFSKFLLDQQEELLKTSS
ncbi:MAG TPA: hypothetical protein VFY09_00295 [Flavobacteriaceae bacterium]|nr:hypothetical protein [Flavobacteriaceae bacterium]HEX5742319.1 hypothetical protein [Flavobacteriaceae bacterium]